jgi:hypothetical protein
MLTPKEILQHVGWIHIWIIWGILLSGWNSTVDIDATDPDSKLLGASSRDTSNILKSRFQRYSKFEAPVAPVAVSRVLRSGLKNGSEVTRHLASGGC